MCLLCSVHTAGIPNGAGVRGQMCTVLRWVACCVRADSQQQAHNGWKPGAQLVSILWYVHTCCPVRVRARTQGHHHSLLTLTIVILIKMVVRARERVYLQYRHTAVCVISGTLPSVLCARESHK